MENFPSVLANLKRAGVELVEGETERRMTQLRHVIHFTEEWRTSGNRRHPRGRVMLWLRLECGHHEQRLVRLNRDKTYNPPHRAKCTECAELAAKLKRNRTMKTDDKVTVLPDGSAFFTASFPLPKDHWIYEPTGEPPMPLRTEGGPQREALAEKIRAAGRYAIKASTMSGKEMDFDPDAMLQNLVVGLIGYWTRSTASEDA